MITMSVEIDEKEVMVSKAAIVKERWWYYIVVVVVILANWVVMCGNNGCDSGGCNSY